MNRSIRRIASVVAGGVLILALAGFGNGDYAVGNGPGLVPPTTFVAPGGPTCYWARYDSTGQPITDELDPEIANKIVTVKSTDAGFFTDDCGNWSPFTLGTSIKSPLAPTPAGDWQVGPDMAVARWVAYPAPGYTCYWERDSDFSHDVDNIIENNLTAGPQLVTLEPTDAMFSSAGCGSWQRVTDDDPGGAFDGFRQGFDTVTATGWALDPNAVSDPVDVDVYVDGQFARRVSANGSRPDVGAALGVPPEHGWQAALSLSQGAHTVCAYAIGIGLGGYNPSLGCRGAFYDGNPGGSLEAAVGGTSLKVQGWVLDPSTASPVSVDVYVDGGFKARLTADQSRPDVGTAFPAFGANHGFGATLNIPDGNHSVCVFAINQLVGSTNPLLGCRNVAVQGNPVGNLEGVSPGLGSVTVSGWMFDPDTPTPAHVHLYLDDAFVQDVAADQSRPDVGAAFPGYGPGHGFRATIPATGSGTHTVCAYGINVGGGTTNPRIGCRTFASGGNPIGNLEAATVTANQLTVSGWAIDPDVTGTVNVHIYVDGQFATVLPASTSRTDLGTAFPAYGPAHGFTASTIPVAPGAHQVCAYAINQGPGTTNPLLGCRNTP